MDSMIKNHQIVVRAGEIIRINAYIKGRPYPEISWEKDGI